MRRILILCLLIVLFVNSCRYKKADSKEITITYNCAANALEIESLQKEIPSFTGKTGITIKLNPFSGDDKLYAMIAADQAPDIFYTNNVMRDKLAAEGHLLDLRTVSKNDSFVQKLFPNIIEQGKSIDSGWYSLTNWVFTCGVYWNKILFDEAGVQYPDSSWTWDEMVSSARKLTRDKNNDGKIDQYGIFIGSHFIEAFEQMNGAPIERNALFASIPQESRDVYNKYLSLMHEGIMPDLRRVQAMGMQAPQMLESGRVAMLVEAVPNTNLFETLTIKWGLAPLPQFDRKQPEYFRSGSGGLSISAKMKHPKAAWEALKWIVSQASIYQPNPVLNDVNFVDGWEKKYPQLQGTGFRKVWELSERYSGGDPRFFVRFSSWTMNPILERLQPKLDQLWARKISVDELVATIPKINEEVKKELHDVLKNRNISEKFREGIKKLLEKSEDGKQNTKTIRSENNEESFAIEPKRSSL